MIAIETTNERIKILRKELELTMDKFGEPLGVRKAAISNIENGNRSVTEQMLKAICREYDVNETWLRTGEGDMFLSMDKQIEIAKWAASVLRDDSNDFRSRFVSMLVSLSDEDWKWLEEKAKMLVEQKNN